MKRRVRVFFPADPARVFDDPIEVHVLNSGALRLEAADGRVLVWAPGRWTHTESEPVS